MHPARRWLLTGCLALSLPFTRSVWEAVRSLNPALADALPLAAGALLAGVILAYLAAAKAERRPAVIIAAAAISAAFLVVFRSLPQPIERVHLAQYGTLSVMVFWAMGGSGPASCLPAFAATVFLGLADECVQGLMAARIYDLNDVILNAKAALLGQGMVAFVLRPWEAGPVRAAARAGRVPPALRIAAALVLAAAVFNILILEAGTPTLSWDVHAGHGILGRRDGYRHFGAAAAAANAGVIASAVLILRSRRTRGSPAAGLRAVIVCGLLPSAVLLAGRLAGFRFR
ncbi:MAG: VanZ family protein [bacterium]|nr:VanZ family protein [bacterium]